MRDLIDQYRKLVVARDIRDEIKAKAKAAYEARLEDELAPYTTVDDDIEKLRGELQKSMNGEDRVEFDDAVLSIAPRRNVVIHDENALDRHCREKELFDLLKIGFHKAKLNKIALAFDDTKMPQLPGVDIETVSQLKVELK